MLALCSFKAKSPYPVFRPRCLQCPAERPASATSSSNLSDRPPTRPILERSSASAPIASFRRRSRLPSRSMVRSFMLSILNNGSVRFPDGGRITPFAYAFYWHGSTTTELYINDRLPGRFVLTWFQRFYSGDSRKAIQLTLFDDGGIQLSYEGAAWANEAFVSVYPANPFLDRRVDFSADLDLTAQPGELVYESFGTIYEDNPFDLAGSFVVFTPNGDGGYSIRHVPVTVGPACNVISPSNGSTLFEGEPLLVEATAARALLVADVMFQSSDGSLSVDDTSSPYTAPFTVPVGVNQITFNVSASDTVGNVGTCSATVSVVPGPPPTVSVVSPAPGAVLTEGSTVEIVVDADNRVPVTRVELLVNGRLLSTDTKAPYTFLLTVPAGMSSLSVSTNAVDSVAKAGTSEDVVVVVVPDERTTVQGRTIDASGAPVAGAELLVYVHGVSAEVFDFATTLPNMPDLASRIPDRTRMLSALNLRNPDAMFGADPFGFGSSPSHVVRFSGTLTVPVAGTYSFTLGVNAGGRLVIGGSTVVDLPNSVGQFQEGTGPIVLPAGPSPVQLVAFDNGNPEVQLSYAPPGGDRRIVPPSALVPALALSGTTSGSDGIFSVPDVPTSLGEIGATARLLSNGTVLTGRASPVAPIAGGITDVGQIRLLSVMDADILFTQDGQIFRIRPDGSNLMQVGVNPANNYHAKWSPDRSKIVFGSDRTGYNEVFLMNADGSGVVNLIENDPSQDMSPSWSPDGTRIAFQSSRSGSYQVWVMDADGSNLVNLTNNSIDNGQPSWSSDGTRIAFVSYPDGGPDIHVINADGSNRRRLTFDGADNAFPSWSPDGTRLIFRKDLGGNQDLYVINADGTNETRLTSEPEHEDSPAWSPDGRRIVFYVSGTLYVMNADGSSRTALIAGYSPNWGVQ